MTCGSVSDRDPPLWCSVSAANCKGCITAVQMPRTNTWAAGCWSTLSKGPTTEFIDCPHGLSLGPSVSTVPSDYQHPHVKSHFCTAAVIVTRLTDTLLYQTLLCTLLIVSVHFNGHVWVRKGLTLTLQAVVCELFWIVLYYYYCYYHYCIANYFPRPTVM